MLMHASLLDAGTDLAVSGRHRTGAPGRIYVTHLVRVRRRSWLIALWRPARHRHVPARPSRQTRRGAVQAA
jgi:hypothetical protein